MNLIFIILAGAAVLIAVFAVKHKHSKGRPMRVLARIDLQNCFMPLDPAVPGTGELPVDGAPAVVPVVNKLSRSGYFDMIVDSQDFHPPDHGSFHTMHPGKKAGEVIALNGQRQILWNPHARQNTPGCEFYPALDRMCVERTFPKGMDKLVDSYSAIWDNGRQHSTGMAEYVQAEARKRGYKGVAFYVCGVTRPFCVSWTAKDAHDFGFDTYLIKDACSLLEIEPGAGDNDLSELQSQGVKVIESWRIPGMTA